MSIMDLTKLPPPLGHVIVVTGSTPEELVRSINETSLDYQLHGSVFTYEESYEESYEDSGVSYNKVRAIFCQLMTKFQ